MFSYLNYLNKQIDTSIIKRGQKIFLDGGVQKLINLPISGWQKTQVIDNNHSYSTIFPLTHQLLSRENWDKTYNLWQELSKCNCHYFLEAGVCRHLVAIASKLDWELQQEVIKAEIFSDEVSFIDLYNQVNSTQIINNLLNQFDGLIISSYNPRQISLLSRITSSLRNLDNESQINFFDDLNLIIRKHIKLYEEEKKIIKIVLDTIKIDPSFWWGFWKDKIALITEYGWICLVKEIFGVYIDTGYNQFKEVNRGILSQITVNCDQVIKDKILNEYQITKNKINTKAETFQKIYEFAIAIGNHKWLLDNLELIDPEKLIALIKILPSQYRDKIDKNIKSQLIQWMAFVTNNQKEEILQLLILWRDSGEISEYWYETIDCIKSTINPKTKLFKEVKELII